MLLCGLHSSFGFQWFTFLWQRDFKRKPDTCLQICTLIWRVVLAPYWSPERTAISAEERGPADGGAPTEYSVTFTIVARPRPREASVRKSQLMHLQLDADATQKVKINGWMYESGSKPVETGQWYNWLKRLERQAHTMERACLKFGYILSMLKAEKHQQTHLHLMGNSDIFLK